MHLLCISHSPWVPRRACHALSMLTVRLPPSIQSSGLKILFGIMSSHVSLVLQLQEHFCCVSVPLTWFNQKHLNFFTSKTDQIFSHFYSWLPAGCFCLWGEASWQNITPRETPSSLQEKIVLQSTLHSPLPRSYLNLTCRPVKMWIRNFQPDWVPNPLHSL